MSPDTPTRRFTRDPRPLALSGIRTNGVCEFLSSLARTSGCERVLAVDLSCGSWRLHQAASDVLTQLGRPDASRLPDAGAKAGEIGRRADAETGGDRPVLDALRLAGEALGALDGGPPTAVCLLPPRRGARLERQDEWFVRFLSHALAGGGHRLLLVAPPDAALRLPRDWSVSWSHHRCGPPPGDDLNGDLLSLVPGVIRQQEARVLAPPAELAARTLALPGGCLLADPSARFAARGAAPQRYDRLAELARDHAWLTAYAACHGSGRALEPWFLLELAGRYFRAGACEVPLALLERADAAMPTPAGAAIVRLQAQAVRIANGRFGEAAAAPAPGLDVPRPLRGFQLMMKGWGLTMTGRAADAEGLLAEARRLLDGEPESEEFLSLLNISALNRLKLGDWEGAHALEERISSALDRLQASVWQFRYINQLNFARLYRRRGRLDEAERCYREAFATADGLRSDSDAIHANVSVARIEEARGRSEEAFAAWSRAALHWLSCEAPEAISGRVTATIAAPDRVEACGNVCDAVSEGLLAGLRRSGAELAAARGLFEPAGRPGAPTFVRPQAVPDARLADEAWVPAVGPGWAVLSASFASTPAVGSTASERLGRALGALIRQASSASVEADPVTVLVDDRQGREIPGSEAELVESCLRLGIRRLALGDGVVSVRERARVRLEDRLQIRRASAVAEIAFVAGRAVVGFKRYLDPLEVRGPLAELVALTGDAPTVASLRAKLGAARPGSVLELLRELERQRVLELHLPGGAFGELL